MSFKQLIPLLFLVSLIVSCTSRSFSPEEINLIPKPGKMELKEQSFQIKASTSLVLSNPEQEKAASYLNGLLQKAAGFSLSKAEQAANNSIVFSDDSNLPSEAYRLEVSPKQITIAASSGAGWFYGVQTIRQLLPAAIESQSASNTKWLVPCVLIEDQPRFGWRGMHMDFSRHFFTVDEVKTFLDYMALYKLNTYHMHLTDDQGWRIEIKKYPLLTEKGAWRNENNQDAICNEKAKTNETFVINPANYKEIDGQKMYGGFFTQEQIREIIHYAADRYISVIPEIDMPGHFKAAIDNYPYLSCSGEATWGKLFSAPACLGQASTTEFMKDILSEVAELFPAPYIHIGGDEVNIEDWKKCPKCQAEIRKNKLKNEHELQSFFNREIEQFLHSKGKRLMGWDEIVEGGLTADASMMWWRNWAPKMRYIAANNGNDMVISPDFEYYFDFTNEATPLDKVYNYEPVPEDFTPEQEKHIIGVQANLWSEWIPNFTRLQIQTFPRLLALAETAWNKKGDKDFDAFKVRVRNHYQRLETMGITYYLPAVQGTNKTYAFVDSAKVELSVDMDGAEIFYTLDGSAPTRESNQYKGPFYVKESGQILTRAFKGTISGEVFEAKADKQEYCQPEQINTTESGFLRWVNKASYQSVEAVSLPAGAAFTAVNTADMGEYANTEHIAFVFKGYFKAETQGIYEFTTKSDDGSLLYIGDKLVVDNGGNHSAQQRAGMVALMPGYHPIAIIFHQGGGGGELSASYTVPGGTAQTLDQNVVSH